MLAGTNSPCCAVVTPWFSPPSGAPRRTRLVVVSLVVRTTESYNGSDKVNLLSGPISTPCTLYIADPSRNMGKLASSQKMTQSLIPEQISRISGPTGLPAVVLGPDFDASGGL